MVAIINNPLFRKPQGYLVTCDPDPTRSRGQQAVVERITVSCGHCNMLVVVDTSSPEPPTELCYGCQRNICLKCVAERRNAMKCDVIERKLERWENGERLARGIAR